MKTILKLLLAVLVINACVQGGRSVWRQFELKGAVEQEARFGDSKTTSALQRRLVQIGKEHGVTLQPEDVRVERRGELTRVALTYTEGIPLIPRVYTYQRTLDVTMAVGSLHPLTQDER